MEGRLQPLFPPLLIPPLGNWRKCPILWDSMVVHELRVWKERSPQSTCRLQYTPVERSDTLMLEYNIVCTVYL